jgi:hypothetical protein
VRLAQSLLALLLTLTLAPAIAGPLFRAGPGVAAIESRATGIFELGTVTLANATVGLRALLQNGHVLQVQSRHEQRWLARRSGSAGGKPVTPAGFDALTTISGGMNVDVRQLQPVKRQQFAATAGLVTLDEDAANAPSPVAQTRRSQPANAVAQCAATRCRISIASPGSASGFTITLDDDAATWSFDGYGILAIWPVPQASTPR